MKKKYLCILIVIIALLSMSTIFYLRDKYINETISKCRRYGSNGTVIADNVNSLTDTMRVIELIDKCDKVGVHIIRH